MCTCYLRCFYIYLFFSYPSLTIKPLNPTDSVVYDIVVVFVMLLFVIELFILYGLLCMLFSMLLYENCFFLTPVSQSSPLTPQTLSKQQQKQ